jgi:hypothetical protein
MCDKNGKGEEDMSAVEKLERYQTIPESLKEALKEVAEIKQGKKKATPFAEWYEQIKKDQAEGRL